MIQPLNPEVYQLGTPTATYQPSARRQTIGKIAGVVLALLGVVIVFFDMAQYRPSGMFILGGLLLALGMWAFWANHRNTGMMVQVFPDGLASTARGTTEIVRWDEMTEVLQQVTKHYTNGVYTGTTHLYTVRRAGKPELKFNDALQNVEALGNTIQQETYKRLLPRAIESYNAGAVLHFGKLSVSKHGLSNGKETVVWPDIKGVKLDKGVISVSKQGKWLNWASATVAQTPNVFVFTALVDAIAGIK